MSSRKEKCSVLVAREELQELLQRLAAGIGAGRIELGAREVALEGYQNLELTLKPIGETVAVKLRVKYARASADPLAEEDEEAGEEGAELEERPPEPEDEGRPKYSRLKKRMNRSFKALRGALQAGALPAPELAADFLADCRQMLEFPGKGDDQYAVFRAAVDRLEQACAAEDLEAATAAALELHQQRKTCHALHK